MAIYTDNITTSIIQQESKLKELMESSDHVLLKNREMDLEFDEMLRRRFHSQQQYTGNNEAVLEDTNEYYSQFHALGSEDRKSESKSRGNSGVLIHGISIAVWDGM